MKSLIIYDWDDTLFPTTWFLKNISPNLNSTNKQILIYIQKQLKFLDTSIYKLLDKSLQHATVIIISNAKYRWLNKSLTYLSLTNQLIKKNILMISTIDKCYYENNYLSNKQLSLNNEQINNLKINVFNKDINIYVNKSKNIINIGDSIYEFNALKSLCFKYFYTKIFKNIKLIIEPSLEEILEEHQILLNNVCKIINYDNNLDLTFNKKI